MRRILFGITVVLCVCHTLQAQKLSGDFHLEGGSNFHMTKSGQAGNHRGGVTAKIGYDTGTISFDVYGKASYGSRYVGSVGATFTAAGEDTTKKAEISIDHIESRSLGAGTNFKWAPDRNNTFKLSYTFSDDRDTPNALSAVTGEIVDKKADRDITLKDTDNKSYSHDAGINYTHLFGKTGKKLESIVTFTASGNDKLSQWLVGSAEGELEKIKQRDIKNLKIDRQYRDTPSSEKRELTAKVEYSDNTPFGVKGLGWDTAFKFDFRDLNDHQSAANLIDGQWVDSTKVRENFRFMTLRLTPSFHLNYKIWKYELDCSYSPEFYSHRLDSDSKTGDIEKGVISHFINIYNRITPWDGHEFKLIGSRSESRPDYLQICWFPRQSTEYANELYQGNINLLPKISLDAAFSYKFSHKRFSTTLDIGYNNTKQKIEKTYNNRVIDGREYRIYTWINGGRSQETNGSIKFSWNGKQLRANVRARYNLYHGVNVEEEETKSGDYRLSGDLEYKYKTWTFATDIDYQSDMKRDYSSIKGMIKCNAKISKTFGKFGVYIQGTDLFDSAIEITTISEDGTEMRHEKATNNSRVFVLGLNYSF